MYAGPRKKRIGPMDKRTGGRDWIAQTDIVPAGPEPPMGTSGKRQRMKK
jgi:hypothetical protein